MKHQRIVVSRHGGPEVLEPITEEAPQPRAGEARVRVLCAGVSAYDLMFRRSGVLPGTPRVPFTPGEDVVGTVDALGEGVVDLEPGQLVAGATFCLGVGGGYAEYVCMPSKEWVVVPPGVDPADAACIVVNYLTAYMAMHTTARIRGSERVLVHGAAGGVGSALLDLGRLAGLEAYGTASTGNQEFVASLGATPIDYRREDFVERVRQLVPGGVDVVFDPIGGARQLWRSYRALGRDGRLVWFGVAASKDRGLRVIPLTLVMRGLLTVWPGRRRILSTGDLGADNRWYRDTLGELLDLLAAKKLTPAIAERVPLRQAARAHALLERGGVAGKIVLVRDG
ncbi:MAG: zinc-binding dehydrogenase [Myxococcales bacterium FL481]|nr:MAG: zinc-binding dehydrogenase [Myxococcales bacterium FL481]